jgi:hypothetical protein
MLIDIGTLHSRDEPVAVSPTGYFFLPPAATARGPIQPAEASVLLLRLPRRYGARRRLERFVQVASGTAAYVSRPGSVPSVIQCWTLLRRSFPHAGSRRPVGAAGSR